MKHILIDFENIQPDSFTMIENPENCHIWLFLGVHQQKSLPYPLVKSLFQFPNTHIHLLEMQHTGKNALDHYLSFYLGKISAIDNQAEVYILARDSGYDVLVEHLNQTHHGLSVFRLKDTQYLPNFGQSPTLEKSTTDSPTYLETYPEPHISKSNTTTAIKTEIINNQQIFDVIKSSPEHTISPAFIHHCFKMTLKKMTDSQGYLPRLKPNLFSAIKKYALNDEIVNYNEVQITYLLEKVFGKFVNYGLIEVTDNKLTYKLSSTDMLNAIKNHVLSQKPSTVETLKNTIQSRLIAFNQNSHDNDIKLVITWLKKEVILFQENHNIRYHQQSQSLNSTQQQQLLHLAIVKLTQATNRIRPKNTRSLQNWLKSTLKLQDTKPAEKIVTQLLEEKKIVANNHNKLTYFLD